MARYEEDPKGPQAGGFLSEVMSANSSAPLQLQQQQHHSALLPQITQQGETPVVAQVVNTVTTYGSGADVEAPDTPKPPASRTALSTDLVPGGEPKRSSSPTPLRRKR